MKSNVTVSVDTDIMKKIRQKRLNASQIAEEAFRNALNPENQYLKTNSPERSLLNTWFGFPYKYRKKATTIFMKKHKGLLPNFDRVTHLEALLKIYSKIVKQTKISLKGTEDKK